MDLALTLRYLRALETMASSPTTAAFAHSVLTELAHPLNQIEEFIQPIATRPIATLTTEERRWRFLVEHRPVNLAN